MDLKRFLLSMGLLIFLSINVVGLTIDLSNIPYEPEEYIELDILRGNQPSRSAFLNQFTKPSENQRPNTSTGFNDNLNSNLSFSPNYKILPEEWDHSNFGRKRNITIDNTEFGLAFDTENITLRPSAAGDVKDLSDSGTPIHFEQVDEVGNHDGYSSYVYDFGSASEVYDLYEISNVNSPPSGKVITQIAVISWIDTMYTDSSMYLRNYIKIDSLTFNGTHVPLAASSGTFYQYTDIWETNPSTDVSWTWEDINNLQIGVGGYCPTTSEYFGVTQVYLNVSSTSERSLTDATLLIDVSDTDFETDTQANGSDILFTTTDGTILPHELESFNQTTGHLQAWVHFPSIQLDESTTISMYYGNSDVVSQENVDDTWYRNYIGVYHFNQTPTDTIIDSSGYDNHLTSTGSMTIADQVSGVLNEALEFDGTDDGLISSSSLTIEEFTFSAWINQGSQTTGNRTIISLGDYRQLALENSIPVFNTATSSDSFGSALTTGQNYFLAVTYNGSVLSVFVNGTLVGSPIAITLSQVTDTLRIALNTSNDFFDGLIDEVHILNSSLTPAQIILEFNNQKEPSKFFSLSPEREIVAPIVHDFGVNQSGYESSALFWANVSDQDNAVDEVEITINSTVYSMSYNSSSGYWEQDYSTFNYGDIVFYQITNASDNVMVKNYLITNSEEKYTSMTYDIVQPSILEIEYYTLSPENTFKANVTDSWGIIDTVIVKVTSHAVSMPADPTRVMNNYKDWGGGILGYVNNTIAMENGEITFKIWVNDSYGNSYESTEESGFVYFNNPPIAENITIKSSVYNNETILSSHDMNLEYDYYDQDGHADSGTEIRWYKWNGTHYEMQVEFNDEVTIPTTDISKNDEWYVTVHPKDGNKFGEWNSSDPVSILNTAPNFITFSLNPQDAYTTSTLSISYTPNDYDGDSIVQYYTEWFNNSVHLPTFDGQLSLTPDDIKKGEIWYVRMKLYDGTDNSSWSISSSITIKNSAPTASSLDITPINPNSANAYTTNDLNASWVFSDIDEDDQFEYYITWYRGIGYQPTYDGYKILPFSATDKNQEWYFKLIVFDSEDNSTLEYSSPIISIINTPPTIESQLLTIDPLTSENLQAEWTFLDNDSDSESTSWIVRWYKDNILQPAYDNSKTIPSSATRKGEAWNYTVKVFDGTNYSIQYNSTIIIIQNSLPQASVLNLSPSNAYTSNNLNASWYYSDEDGDEELSSWIIRWYRDDTLIGDYNDLITIPSSATIKGEEWYFSLQVYDGEDYSLLYFSSTVTIKNTPPTASELTIEPINPNRTDAYTNNDLYISWLFKDNDTDSQVSYFILWFKDDNSQPAYDGFQILPSSATSKGQRWKFELILFDGEDNSTTEFPSPSITIINTPPTIESQLLTIDPLTSENLQAEWTFLDNDSDSESTSWIVRWYKDNILQPYNNSKAVPSSATKKGEVWNFTVKVFDGTHYSIQYNSTITIIQNSPPKIEEFEFIFLDNSNVTGGIRTNEFYVEDEDLSVHITQSDPDDPIDIDLPKICWFKILINGTVIEMTTYENKTIIPSNKTNPGEIWNCTIIPYDGFDQGEKVEYSILIEIRPVILITEINFDVKFDDDGSYFITIPTLYADAVILSFNDSTNDLVSSNVVGTNFTFNYYGNLTHLSEIIKMSIRAFREIKIGQSDFEINEIYIYHFQLKDEVAPRIISSRAYLSADHTEITFNTTLQESGSEIVTVIVYYSFIKTQGGVAAMINQMEYNVETKFQRKDGNIYYYSITIPYKENSTNWKINHLIVATDSAGNVSPNRFEGEQIPSDFKDSGFPLPFLIAIIGIIIIFASVGSLVFVKFIRKPEIVGLDKDLVLLKSSEVSSQDIDVHQDNHTFGIVISFFDQHLGPVPIVVVPEILEDNFNKLIRFSDKSFSSSGFVKYNKKNNEYYERESSFHYELAELDDQNSIDIHSITYAFSLDRPLARGKFENITLNILVYPDLFPIVNLFTDFIKLRVQKIHELMDKSSDKKKSVLKEIKNLRLFISAIILAYVEIYGVTEVEFDNQ